jgi:hypothetical protein
MGTQMKSPTSAGTLEGQGTHKFFQSKDTQFASEVQLKHPIIAKHWPDEDLGLGREQC